MKAIILVGGQGTRMRPLTLDIPKPLLPIANIPFIERQIKWLISYGVSEVVLSLCYLPNQFEEYFAKNPIDGVSISYVVEDEPLGTGGAIKFSAGDIDGSVIVCNGDVLTTIDLKELVELHDSVNSLATIALTQVEDPSAFGVVPTNEDKQVIAFVEKPSKELAPSNWINAGIYVLSREFLDLIPSGLQVSIERETFPKAIVECSMYALESNEYWLDIGTIEKYLQAHTDFLSNMSPSSDSNRYKEVAENIFSDGKIEIGEGTVAKSKCLIGKGSKIGRNCTLDSISVGKNTEIGDSTFIESSVIFSDSIIGNEVSISSSIIGKNSAIGNKVVLDDNCAIGSNEKIDEGSRLIATRIPPNE